MTSTLLTLTTIALVLVAQAVEIYPAIDGGYNVFIGDYGYHFAQREN